MVKPSFQHFFLINALSMLLPAQSFLQREIKPENIINGVFLVPRRHKKMLMASALTEMVALLPSVWVLLETNAELPLLSHSPKS